MPRPRRQGARQRRLRLGGRQRGQCARASHRRLTLHLPLQRRLCCRQCRAVCGAAGAAGAAVGVQVIPKALLSQFESVVWPRPGKAVCRHKLLLLLLSLLRLLLRMLLLQLRRRRIRDSGRGGVAAARDDAAVSGSGADGLGLDSVATIRCHRRCRRILHLCLLLILHGAGRSAGCLGRRFVGAGFQLAEQHPALADASGSCMEGHNEGTSASTV